MAATEKVLKTDLRQYAARRRHDGPYADNLEVDVLIVGAGFGMLQTLASKNDAPIDLLQVEHTSSMRCAKQATGQSCMTRVLHSVGHGGGTFIVKPSFPSLQSSSLITGSWCKS